MAQVQISVRVRFAWWVRWYLSGVALTARLTGLEPDMEKVSKAVVKGIRVRVST